MFYKRSWSIQEALEQHTALGQQKEVAMRVAANRARVRQAQVQFAKQEVESGLALARRGAPEIIEDPSRILMLASQIRRAAQELALVNRLKEEDEVNIQQHLETADIELEKSRLEMKNMKTAIDDKGLVVATEDVAPPPKPASDRAIFYCTNCKVGGHGQRFCEYLVQRPEWQVYPYQRWFEDEQHNEYHCPLGKRIVDFADESHFSRIAMYIKGRIWLEDKTKMYELVPDLMPETYVINDRKWVDGKEPTDADYPGLPWFVKEADRNWGTSVNVCGKASQCMDLAKPGALYVVQPHIKDPLLMEDGRKCHIKFYVLLMCLEDAVTWELYTFKDGYLSISPHAWSPDDLSKETQVTIIRTERIRGWPAWPTAYPKCKAGVAEVIKRGVAQGKLEGRPGKRQFEILSADFIVDTHDNVWLFEFNMSPVLKDPHDHPTNNDGDMIVHALDIVVPHEGGSPGDWDFAGRFVGEPPQPPTSKETVGGASSSTSNSAARSSTTGSAPPPPMVEEAPAAASPAALAAAQVAQQLGAAAEALNVGDAKHTTSAKQSDAEVSPSR